MRVLPGAPGARAGFQELVAAHPSSSYLVGWYAKFAVLAGDQRAARECFARLAGHTVVEGFGDASELARCRKWAGTP